MTTETSWGAWGATLLDRRDRWEGALTGLAGIRRGGHTITAEDARALGALARHPFLTVEQLSLRTCRTLESVRHSIAKLRSARLVDSQPAGPTGERLLCLSTTALTLADMPRQRLGPTNTHLVDSLRRMSDLSIALENRGVLTATSYELAHDAVDRGWHGKPLTLMRAHTKVPSLLARTRDGEWTVAWIDLLSDRRARLVRLRVAETMRHPQPPSYLFIVCGSDVCDQVQRDIDRRMENARMRRDHGFAHAYAVSATDALRGRDLLRRHP